MRSEAAKPNDWHREDVKAALRKSGVTLTELAAKHGMTTSNLTKALRLGASGSRRVQALVAAHLGLSPRAIWPSRYGTDGQPIDRPSGGRSRPTGQPPEHHRQNQEAA